MIRFLTRTQRRFNAKWPSLGLSLPGKAGEVIQEELFGPSVPAGTNYSATGSGGAVSGGAATAALVKVHQGSGGGIVGGLAAAVLALAVIGSGGGAPGGAATFALAKVHQGSGGAVSGGVAEVQTTILRLDDLCVGSGGAVSGGAATFALAKVHQGSGGGAPGGAATFALAKVHQGSGGGAPGGVATFALAKVHQGSGGAVSGGAAEVQTIIPLPPLEPEATLSARELRTIQTEECRIVGMSMQLAQWQIPYENGIWPQQWERTTWRLTAS